MMKPSAFLRSLMPLAGLLALSACNQDIAATSDEHETSVVAHLFNHDGTPAVGARVRFFSVGDTAQIPVAQVYVGADGSVPLPTLPKGQYTLLATDGSGNGVMIDSLLSTGTGVPSLPNDTLRPMGVIKARLVVEPQHSPRIAWIQVLGMGLATNVDTLGNFRLAVPAGVVTLAAMTRHAEYTPTFRTIRSFSDSVLDLGSIRLEYTGIPVVEGLKVVYDSLTGVATVSWKRAHSSVLRGYYLYGTSGGQEELGIADTVFHDTLFWSSPISVDTNRKERRYQVVAFDSSWSPGLTWGAASISIPSPWTRPWKGLRRDTLGVFPAEGCDEIDTLAGGLVCFRKHQTHWWRFAQYFHITDSMGVSTSSDGRVWNVLPIPPKILQYVPWEGRIWVARGIPTGDSASVNTFDYGTEKDAVLPLYKGVVVESWVTDGTMKRVDTLMDSSVVFGYRLVVIDDTLVLSRDSARVAPAVFSGTQPISLGAMHLVAPDGEWSREYERDVPDEFPAWSPPDSDTESAWKPISWNGMKWWVQTARYLWESEEGNWVWGESGQFFAKGDGDGFPWVLGYAQTALLSPMMKYRGNSKNPPLFLTWKGCAILGTFGVYETQKKGAFLAGLCPD